MRKSGEISSVPSYPHGREGWYRQNGSNAIPQPRAGGLRKTVVEFACASNSRTFSSTTRKEWKIYHGFSLLNIFQSVTMGLSDEKPNAFAGVDKIEVSSDSEHGIPLVDDGKISFKTKMAVFVSLAGNM
jgi:hypothetical protein